VKKFLEILKKNKMKAFGVLAVIALAFSFFVEIMMTAHLKYLFKRLAPKI